MKEPDEIITNKYTKKKHLYVCAFVCEFESMCIRCDYCVAASADGVLSVSVFVCVCVVPANPIVMEHRFVFWRFEHNTSNTIRPEMFVDNRQDIAAILYTSVIQTTQQ